MSENDNESDLGSIILFLFIGFIVGSIITIITMTLVAFNYDMSYYQKQIDQYNKDCQIKEYYYLDSHRSTCDKLGFVPK